MRTRALAVWVILLCGTARGSIIVDHQPHPFGGLGSDTAFLSPFGQPVWQQVADDFTLASKDQAMALFFWGFYNEDNPPLMETMRIRFYLSRPSDGLPDDNNIISETTVQNPSRVATGVVLVTGHGPHEYLFHVNLDAPVSLSAGTRYWLEVAQIGDASTHFRWEDSVLDLNGLATINSIHPWQSTYPGGPADAAFQIISPEPSLLCPLVLGLLLLVRRVEPRGEKAGQWMEETSIE